MELNELQKQAVTEWVAAGAGISEVQKRLHSEFDLNLTYMDVRFLLIDLEMQVKDKPAVPAADPGAADNPNLTPEDSLSGAAPGGGVRVDFDRVVQAGALVSGSVTFSDGATATWMLDQMGRLAINAAKPGYRPSEPDLQAFQVELRNGLQKMGF